MAIGTLAEMGFSKHDLCGALAGEILNVALTPADEQAGDQKGVG